MAVLTLAALALSLFGPHLLGWTLFVGNADRLHTFLNVRLFAAEQLRAHGGVPAWTDRLFMGAPLDGLHWMLPAIDPTALLLSLAPPDQFMQASGLISAAHVILAALAAYLFLRDYVPAAFPCTIGAGLYVCSTFAVHRISQVDAAFAVLIFGPLGLWLLRRAGPGRIARCGPALTALIALLLGFTFLQEVAYTLMLWGVYAIFRAVSRRDIRPLAALAVAGLAGILLAAPRLGAVLQDAGGLSRSSTFGTLCACEVLRWLHDGIYGRTPAEVRLLGNNLNLNEGLQLYTSTLTPLLLLYGIGQGLLQRLGVRLPGSSDRSAPPDSDVLFFTAWLVLVFAVMLIDGVRYGLYLAFFQVDFSHTRVVVTGLLPISLLVAVMLARLIGRPAAAPTGWLGAPWLQPAAGVALALMLLLLMGPLAMVVTGVLFGPTERVILAWWLPATSTPILGQIGAAGLLFGVLVGAQWLLTMRGAGQTRFRWLVPVPAYALGGLILLHAQSDALSRLYGPATHTYPVPFAGDTIFNAPPTALRPPSASALAALAERLETDQYRSVIVSAPDGYPTFDTPSERGNSAHIAQFWRLRLVDGYPTLSRRLAELPWPESSRSLRAISFPRAETVPWPLLAVLNVKYAVIASPPLLFNVPGTAGNVPEAAGAGRIEASPADLQIVENPLQPVPRVFFARRIVPQIDRPPPTGDANAAPMALVPIGRPATGLEPCGVVEVGRVEPPCAVSAVTDGVGAITVTWQPPENPLAVAVIDMSSAVDRSLGQPIQPRDGVNSHTVTGLLPNTVYRVRMRACLHATCSPHSPVQTVAVGSSLTAADLQDRLPLDPLAESRVEGILEPLAFPADGGPLQADFQQDRVTVDLTPASTPRFLILNELYHPGWRAYAGESELPILPTNTVMRGLIVPPQVTHIELRFVPFLRTWPALTLTLAGLLIAVGGTLGLRWLDTRAAGAPVPPRVG